MKNKPANATIDPTLVIARGHKLFHESTPGIRPTLDDGFILIAIISTKASVKAEAMSNDKVYATLINQSQQLGAYFEIGLYSLPQRFLPN
jgi:hypothetical protein